MDDSIVLLRSDFSKRYLIVVVCSTSQFFKCLQVNEFNEPIGNELVYLRFKDVVLERALR
ncbi:hypothetical protein VCSRO123_0538 [Vibrio cholerae]|uniref:hypothetical protein n=1 Tax=Vibrio cholerae TaxID=666 RepID=UPI001302A436|nr:hypothetical protein [Vibrio cholerae]ELJ8711755.1 hypothetical protein [Vibrio cholerae]GHZ15274.1 hypothetical protein VCSRO123_0538 [Vibrio cholerae]GIA10359.1 hypothetical protein VCSRO84_0473 [Vibrio cholerae]HAS3378017.1 hypothetical protein [Vibrio cholerae]HAS3407822.1 hypothetical protein [Vibrio cholerae]